MNAHGHDAVHTLDLADGNRTTDQEVIRVADEQQRIVFTKDDDFVQSHSLRGRPSRLLLVATGNIGNEELEALLLKHLSKIESAFNNAVFVEVRRDGMVVHR